VAALSALDFGPTWNEPSSLLQLVAACAGRLLPVRRYCRYTAVSQAVLLWFDDQLSTSVKCHRSLSLWLNVVAERGELLSREQSPALWALSDLQSADPLANISTIQQRANSTYIPLVFSVYTMRAVGTDPQEWASLRRTTWDTTESS